MEFAWHPYPSGGALYELELYPIIQHCDGMTPGLYYYDPFAHRLERVAEATCTLELLAEVGHSAGIAPDRLQVVLLLAARFPRVFWKYSGIGYATILKNVGCVYQTMYLAATAMGLAPCAIGAGDSEAFAEATGNPGLLEGSVGEFLLGSVNVADRQEQ
jgi:SagB-type dehydrogenase family enzyme